MPSKTPNPDWIPPQKGGGCLNILFLFDPMNTWGDKLEDFVGLFLGNDSPLDGYIEAQGAAASPVTRFWTLLLAYPILIGLCRLALVFLGTLPSINQTSPTLQPTPAFQPFVFSGFAGEIDTSAIEELPKEKYHLTEDRKLTLIVMASKAILSDGKQTLEIKVSAGRMFYKYSTSTKIELEFVMVDGSGVYITVQNQQLVFYVSGNFHLSVFWMNR